MPAFFPVNHLEVIGCTEVPILDPAMPRVLSAIFRERGTGKVLFPPYALDGASLLNPVISDLEEFAELVACEEISQFGPVAAVPDYELWLDDTGEFRYQEASTIRTRLKQIAKDYCLRSEAALLAVNYEKARTDAMVAYAAKPRDLRPLTLRAAAEQLMIAGHSEPARIKAELAFTEEIASDFTLIESFRRDYRAMAEKVRPTLANKFSGVAAKKPKDTFSCRSRNQELALA